MQRENDDRLTQLLTRLHRVRSPGCVHPPWCLRHRTAAAVVVLRCARCVVPARGMVASRAGLTPARVDPKAGPSS